MNVSVAVLPELALSPDRIRFTRDKVARMAELGLFEGRYELLGGELISKTGQKPPHSYVIQALNDMLGRRFGTRRLRIQLPVAIPDPLGIYYEPEPNVAVLKQESSEFLSRHPGPEDVAIIIEVADTTLDRDRSVKYRLYAETGIPEYWIIDLQGRRTFVCRRPAGLEYQSVEILPSSEPLPVEEVPGEPVTLDKLLS